MTASVKAQDSIKYGIDESKCLVDAWVQLPKVIVVKDSLQSKVELQKGLMKNDSIEIQKRTQFEATQAETIKEQKALNDDLIKQVGKSERSRSFFKGAALIESIVIVYEGLKYATLQLLQR